MLATITRPQESYEARRRRELGHDLADVQARLDALNDKLRRFRSIHTFWYAPAGENPRVCWRVPSSQILPELKAELAAMESDRAKLAVLKDALLREYGTVKG